MLKTPKAITRKAFKEFIQNNSEIDYDICSPKHCPLAQFIESLYPDKYVRVRISYFSIESTDYQMPVWAFQFQTGEKLENGLDMEDYFTRNFGGNTIFSKAKVLKFIDNPLSV
jgi:hypothetical protein